MTRQKATASSKQSNVSAAPADCRLTTFKLSPVLRTSRLALYCALLLGSLGVGSLAVAQASSTLPDAPDPITLSVKFPGIPQPDEAGYAPLTGRQRSSLFFKGYLGSPYTYLEAVAVAAGQWTIRVPDGWPRTTSGYGKRAGSELTLLVLEEGIHEGGDAALGLDPRYFHCRCTGVWKRSGHALKMTFLAYNAEGHLRPDLPRLVGDYGASMLVTTWYPSGFEPTVQGVQMGHAQVGFDVGVNVLREFSPELKRIFRRKTH